VGHNYNFTQYIDRQKRAMCFGYFIKPLLGKETQFKRQTSTYIQRVTDEKDDSLVYKDRSIVAALIGYNEEFSTVFNSDLTPFYTVFNSDLTPFYTIFNSDLTPFYTLFHSDLTQFCTVFNFYLTPVYTLYNSDLTRVYTVFNSNLTLF
jgi:hypothetical protein